METKTAWSQEWDDACRTKSLENFERRFDRSYQLIKATIGPGFKIHSALSPGREVHETRGSAHYALELLERGADADRDRAVSILRELIANQDADPDSKTFGLWGYYHEEPAREMKPPDYNWADFIGTVLLLIVHRHEAALPRDLSPLVRIAIERAALCSIKRNVSMYYTNIAVKSTFLIVGAAELLGDAALETAAAERLAKFAAAQDATGSWAEFNSPTYAVVSLTNFARMRQYWHQEEARALALRLERSLWRHLANHWHAPTRQFTGPMSRCYRTDLADDKNVQAMLQKATRGHLDFFASPEDLPGAGDVALHDFRCPDDLVAEFVTLASPKGHRECYEPKREGIRPMQGTVWKTPRYALGTINRLDLWTQRRDLLLRWKRPEDSGSSPVRRHAVLRFLKDGYDFASAALVCAQEKGSALGIVTFARGAGDKHLSLDRLTEGAFAAADLRLSLEFVGLPDSAIPDAFAPEKGAVLDLAPGLRLAYRLPAAAWGGAKVTDAEVRRGKDGVVGLDLIFHQGAERTFAWSDVKEAYAAFSLSLHGAGDPPPDGGTLTLETSVGGDGARETTATWNGPAARLAVTTRADIPAMDRIYAAASERVNGQAVPIITPGTRGA